VVLRACPKMGKKPRKPRRPLAVRGRLKRRALAIRWRQPTFEQKSFAVRCSNENRARSADEAPTVALRAVLAELGVRFWQEEIVWYDGDLFVLVDFWLPDHKIGIELDGLQHRRQHVYDWEKDKMVREVTGFTVKRFWNSWATKAGLRDRVVEMLEI